MSNPDKNNSQGVSSFLISLPIGILFFLIMIVLYQYKDILPVFMLFIWLGVPIMALLVVFFVNLATQYTSCGTTDPGKAVLGSLPSVGTVLLGLAISSFALCRIPIASVFAPLIIGDDIDVISNKSNTNTLKNSNSKGCCTQKLSIHSVESKHPIIQGISYGFYSFFSILFGITVGNGFATIC